VKICFVSPEVFSWGVHGGFGHLTRTLSRELAEREFEVSVVTVRRQGQREVEELDGVKIYGYPSHGGKPHLVRAALSRIGSLRYYRKADADIYHSQAISYNTIAAQRAMPDRLHLVTFQDPYDEYEWARIAEVDSRYAPAPLFKTRCAFEARVLASACHRADALYTQARFLIPKATRTYHLKRRPGFLPNPVRVPRRMMHKTSSPTVCFLARWDPQKRVERFFRLAREFPDVEFIAMGRSHSPATDARLRREYAGVLNLSMPGFVSEEEKSLVLEGSWALVNTSVREALPVSFLEALAHETPIISGENPDGLTQGYGRHVKGDDYASGIRAMLESDDWFRRGREGRMLMEEVYEAGKVVDMHVRAYEGALERGR